MSSEAAVGFLALRERAYAFLAAQGAVSEAALLAHVYGGSAPPGLSAKLAAPLLGDARLERQPDGQWALVGRHVPLEEAGQAEPAWTALALLASGPNPDRARIVRISALHMRHGMVVERFSATLNPGVRVPGYVAERLGMSRDVFDDLPSFAAIADDLVRFVGSRAILAQDAELKWEFLIGEARRAGLLLAELPLIDANGLAHRLLELGGKPSLGLVAAKLGVGTVRLHDPDEEVRVLAAVGIQLFARGQKQGDSIALQPISRSAKAALRRPATARALPDEPGVYVMRDTDQAPLYVGKARRLRSRVASYVQRPLGPTRRLEGLVGTVQAVDTTSCATDLEALILEDREIRRLQPRFNTARQQRASRLWIRLPPRPAELRDNKTRRAPRRLERSLGPSSQADGDFVGPFRNAAAADAARLLARKVFDLDTMRLAELDAYEAQLSLAWAFLHGDRAPAESLARGRSRQLLRAVLDFDVESMLLPADPREARYAVVRPGPTAVEGFRIDRGIFRGWAVLEDRDAREFAVRLLADDAPARTGADDVDVVVHWLGAQRAPAQLICLPDDPLLAADVVEDATSTFLPGFWEA